MSRRRRSRESALQVLYPWDAARQDPQNILDHYKEQFLLKDQNDPYRDQIVRGVLTHWKEIDQLLKQYSKHWQLDRITRIDHTILRIAIFELLYCEETPPKVALNEAVDLGKQYGSEDSGRFINGILDRILNEVVLRSAKTASMNS